ncbi:MAG: amidohydrolase/deacetylase family metallohydrolase [Lactobacillales bacterium]|jgi:dihydroorotase|nr:amidohydrolase/deacetylase family metallohydrolase [Lactobacillales bacterium]
MSRELLMKQVRTVDSKGRFDILVVDGKIKEIAPEIQGNGTEELLLLDETSYLSAGWIDGHVHCFEKLDLYYDYPDEVGVKQGVTTIVDAGSTGADTISGFYPLAQEAKTNVYALLNISQEGIITQDELSDLEKIQLGKILSIRENYPNFILGIKARMSKSVVGENGITPLKMAKKIQQELGNVPLMVHIGSAPPTLEEIVDVVEKGDILTHCFNGKANGIYDFNQKKLKDFAVHCKEEGVIFDIGHGTDSFNFEVAEEALHEGIKADSISTDIYIRNRKNGPVYNLATTMEKLHVVGYSWSEILEKVTKAPAKQLGLTTKGKLEVGYDADFTIFQIHDTMKVLIDSNGNERTTDEVLEPQKAIIGGVIYDINE